MARAYRAIIAQIRRSLANQPEFAALLGAKIEGAHNCLGKWKLEIGNG
jgi:hypothetical protein